MYRLICALLSVPALAACTAKTPHPVSIATIVPVPPRIQPEPAWRQAIAPRDSVRLTGLATDWRKLHARLRAVTRQTQGAVLDPGAGLDNAALPPGSYRCRTLHMRSGQRGAVVQATAPGFCFVSGEENSLGFAKQTGTDIAAGYFYPDGNRYVFLGARQRKAGENSHGYGTDPKRDMVGVAERFANFRWRLAVPGPRAGDVDVYELTPVPVEQQPKS
ncbi:DUF4893 domain-containing protein [Sphingomonas sp. JC676]|uniref:DUF4893 domain-containing protein n=1 Tax=Sphingomonas sp. JC676 TaxID=2768065 RepID=UPI00165839FF|nr:DUF4893 domain-containing protein [Sphingomonas sp. JC676]MBC9033972.1 DUF4893 domain-containing protein [Sphingomonas sp. JC676]